MFSGMQIIIIPSQKTEYDDYTTPEREFMDYVDALAILPPAWVGPAFDALMADPRCPRGVKQDEYWTYKRDTFIGKKRVVPTGETVS